MKDQRPLKSAHRRPRPTETPADHEMKFVAWFVGVMKTDRNEGLNAYKRGDFSPRSHIGLLKHSSVLWSGERLRAYIFPQGKDPYDLVTGSRIVGLALIASHAEQRPMMTHADLTAQMERADREGRYGIEELDPGAVPTRAPMEATGDESLDALLAEAEDMLEQLAPAYEQMHRRVNTLQDFGAPPGRPEFDEIREEAQAAYSPLARIALKAELDRQTLLHQEEPSEARRRLIFSLARELSFSLALLSVAESHADEETLGIGMSSLRDPQEISSALSGR